MKIFLRSYGMKSLKRLMLFLPFVMLFSCEEWTPEADGYFTINGKRYDVHVLAIYHETFGSPPYYNTQVILQGAPYVNITIFVSTPSPTLTTGTYHVSWGYEPNGINSIDVRTSSAAEITNDIESEGEMQVTTSDKRNYLVDFEGELQGKTVTIHYSGLVSQQ